MHHTQSICNSILLFFMELSLSTRRLTQDCCRCINNFSALLCLMLVSTEMVFLSNFFSFLTFPDKFAFPAGPQYEICHISIMVHPESSHEAHPCPPVLVAQKTGFSIHLGNAGLGDPFRPLCLEFTWGHL